MKTSEGLDPQARFVRIDGGDPMSSDLPQEPGAFSEHVARLVKDLCPDREVELVGVFELRINGRHLNLENLFRMVQHSAAEGGGDGVIERYLSHLIEGEAASNLPLPIDIARSRIMPRIQPESIFGHLDREMVVHQPFVNETVVLYVIDLPHLTYSITVEQMLQWGMDVEDIDQLARRNLVGYAPELEVRFVEADNGGRAAIVAEHDGYDASRLLLGDLYRRLAPHLGGSFYVATPARDTFVAVSASPDNFLGKIHEQVGRDFHRLPYPITDRFFLVTLDGIAGTVAA